MSKARRFQMWVSGSVSASFLYSSSFDLTFSSSAVFSPRLAGFVLDAFSAAPAPSADPELDQLTAREREVLRLLARGYAYKEIARELTISVKTVESHASAVLRKLQLSNRSELSRWASERRLI